MYSDESKVARPCKVDRLATSSALEEGFRCGTGSSKREIKLSRAVSASDDGGAAEEKDLVANGRKIGEVESASATGAATMTQS